jgi:hypothetical protein
VGHLAVTTDHDRRDFFGDVLVDEISLAETGLVAHEILFEKATMIIHAETLIVSWEPFAR